jgi:hypothetical protein
MLAAKAELDGLVLLRAEPQNSILPQQAMKPVDNKIFIIITNSQAYVLCKT